jgi:hypothetical protein
MKKLFILVTIFLAWIYPSMAHPVDQASAHAVAVKFMGTRDLQLAATYKTDKNAPAFYVFNTTDGFVIVAADDCETPIIGYSLEGCFDADNVPIQMEAYLQDFVARIQYGIDNHIVADEVTARQWQLVKTTGRLNDNKSLKAVGPLLTEKWHQGCLYNSLCPAMGNTPCDHAEVGCVAVAMGQIMHYWRYPTIGWGSHSYFNLEVQHSADFGNTTYDWGHMPDSLTENSSEAEIDAVATLLYHCGVSVNMQYSQDGSAADSGSVPSALIQYFNYSKRLHREKQSNYSNEEWLSLLKQCLDLLRPVFYSGNNNAGGHAFVCDGYDGNDLLHFNWGWGGDGNGYFALGNLNPLGYGFNSKNYAILDINTQYEPWIVSAFVTPSRAGTIEGVGEYHTGDTCTLTAIPAEGYEFYCWKNNGSVKSYDTSVSFSVNSDIDSYEAVFRHLPVTEIAACYTSDANHTGDTCVSLSWLHEDANWTLLKQFEIHQTEQGGVATDGEYIYTSSLYWSIYTQGMFEKYTMDGEFVEGINLDTPVYTSNITYDGEHFYCSASNNYDKLYRIDLANKTLVDITELEDIRFRACAFDSFHDGLWLADMSHNRFVFINRQGQMTSCGPLVNNYRVGAIGYLTAADGSQHLLIVYQGQVYDHNVTINDNTIIKRPLLNFDTFWGSSLYSGASIGKYDGKDALYINNGANVLIFEIKNTLAEILGYRLYRTQENGDTIIIADGLGGTSYTDTTWPNTSAGVYRYGICSVFANGVESEIVWSNPIVKTDYGIEEHERPLNPTVKKVFENGHIVIIKDGKKYSVTGQEIK